MANEFVVKNGLITPTVQLPGATSGSITISAPAVAGTTTIALPATAGTIVTTGDTGTVTNSMLAGSIANDKLVNSTISGTALGSTLPTLTLSTSGTGLAGSTTYNATGAATFTVTSNATSANTASTIVSRDSSGNFVAGTITAALVGNASTATTLQTARTISLSGDVVGSVSFDGSGNANIATTIQADSVALGTDTTGNYVATVAVSGTGLSVTGSGSETAAVTITSNATNANTASTIVARDASGNFSAGTITAALSGNATTASALQTARTISLTGDVTGSVSFDGSGNAAISTTIQPDSVALGTDTTGNYMVNVTGGTGVSVSHTQGEGSTATVSIGQAVGTTDNVTFNNVTVNGTLTSDDITSANISVSGNATITGNLTVSGTTTTVNSTTVALADLNLELARNAANAAQANGAGITVIGPTTAATFTYTSADDRWNLNKNLNVTTVFGALSGNATTASAWQNARTLSFTGDTTGSMSVDGSANVSAALTLANSGVTAGTYNNVTVNAKGLVTSGSNVAYLTSYSETDTLATVTARGNSTSTSLALTGTNPISLQGNSNNGTYTQSVIYANQNNTSANDSNGIFIERGRITDSASAEIRNFVIGARGGQIQWKLDGSGNSTQAGYASLTSDSAQLRLSRTDASGPAWSFYSWTSGLNIFPATASTIWIGRDGGSTDLQLYNGNLYAPIMYDFNNTGYYVDPNGTSNLVGLTVANTITGSITGTAGGETLATVTGRGGSTSNSVTLSGMGNQFGGHFYFLAYDAAGNHYPHFNDGGSASGSKINWRLYTGGTNSVTHSWQIGYTYFANRVESASDMRATLYYDATNTSYYVDPNSGTSAYLAGIVKTNNERLVLRDDSIEVHATDNDSAGIAMNYYGYAGGTTRFRNFNVYDGKTAVRLNVYGQNNYTQATGSLRAPLFYDSDDTYYYVNPNAGSSLRNARFYTSADEFISITNDDLGATHYTQLNGRYLTSNGTNWLADGKDVPLVISGSWAGTERGRLGLALHNENAANGTYSPAIIFGTRSNSGSYNSAYAYIMGKKTGYPSGIDTNWNSGELHFYAVGSGYLNDTPSMRLWNHGDMETINSVRTPIFYDSNDTGYYTDPASTSNLNALTTNAQTILGGQIYVSGTNANTLNSGWGIAGEADIWINYRGYNDGWSHFRNFNIGNGKGTAIFWASGTTGNIGIGTDQTAGARLHVRRGTPSGVQAINSNATVLLDNTGDNFIQFRNSADNGTYSGLLMSDNNQGGYVVFGNAGGAGDVLRLGGYGAVYFDVGTQDSTTSVALKTTAGLIDSAQNMYAYGSMRSPIFYDYNDTGYYADPNSISNMWALKLNRTTDHQLQVARIRGLNTDLTGDYIHMYERVHIGYPSGWGGIDAPSYGLSTWGQIHWNRSMGATNWGYGVLSMDSGWGGTGNYPTIGSGGSSGSLIMLHNVHLPFRTDNARTGASGRAGIRLAVDAAATSWWDVGLTGDAFEIYRSSSGTQQLWINSDGDVSARASSRAPIFYDSADTNYYLDANSTSTLYRIRSYYIKNAYDVAVDHPFGLYFSNDESTAYAIYRESGAWNYPYPDLRIAFHTGIKIGANAGYKGVRFYTDYDMSSLVMSVNNDDYVSGGVYVHSDLRAPIMYDANNTGYYADPASTSVFNRLILNDNHVQAVYDDVKRYSNLTASGTQAIRHTIGRIYFCPNHWGDWSVVNIKLQETGYSQGSIEYNIWGWYGMGNGSSLIIDAVRTNGWARADYRVVLGSVTSAGWQYAGHNTYYQDVYVDIDYYASVEAIIGVEQSTITNSNPASGSGWAYVFYDSPATTNISSFDETHQLRDRYSRINTADFRAPIFYDNDNTGYYLNPDSTSNLYEVYATNFRMGNALYLGNNNYYINNNSTWFGSNASFRNDVDVRAPIFYDQNDTGYYVDPNSQSFLYYTSVNVGNETTGGGNSSSAGLVLRGNYNSNTWAHKFHKYDNGGGVPLYLSKTVGAGSWTAVQGWGNGLTYDSQVFGSFGSTSVYSTIFYDSDDTAYYVDPNAISRVWGLAIRGDNSATGTQNQIFFWGSGNSTTSSIGFKQVGGVWAEHGRTNGGYNTYFSMDSPGRGWVFRNATGGDNFTGTNVFSISNNTGETTVGSAWGTNTTFAQLNITQGIGGATLYRDIDLRGSWSGGEGHAITATHGTTSSDIVGQMVFQHDGPGSRIKWGRLYHSGNQSTYPMELVSNSSTAYLRLDRDLYISGGGSGNYGNRLIVGNTDTSYTLQDTNLRPTIQAHGQYPVLSLNHTVTTNTQHGPTIQFTSNGTGHQFVIGTNGTGTMLSMGYSNSATWNPHNGISGYEGTSFFQAETNGYIGIGSEGDWTVSGGSGTHTPGYNLHFIGSNNATNGHAAFFDNRVNATNNGAGFLFRNLYGNHSWGVVAEYRIDGAGDRPSILFSSNQVNTSWSVGFVTGSDDTFRITKNHGHRAYYGGWADINAGWGTPYLTINTSGNVTAPVDMRSPIYYDSNDTAYYTDPASTSRIRKTNLIASGSGWDDGLNLYSSDATNRWNLLVDEGANDSLRIAYNNSEAINVNTSRNVTISVDIRSPIFYDSNDTAYYVDPASTTNLNEVLMYNMRPRTERWHTSSEGQARFYFSNNNTTYIRTGNAFVFRNASDVGVATIQSNGNMRVASSGDNFAGSWALQVGGTGYAELDFRAPVFYDSGNTAYYADIASTSNLNQLILQGQTHYLSSGAGEIQFIRNGASSSVTYDFRESGLSTTSTSYGVMWLSRTNHTNGTNDGSNIYFRTKDSNGTLVEFAGVGGQRNSSNTEGRLNFWVYNRNNIGYATSSGLFFGIYYDSSNSAYYFDGNATGTSINVAGSIVAAGNVTAYSDIRLKTDVQPIENAIDKVKQINGVTYTRKENNKRQTGVIAQDVLKVLPEAVEGSEEGMYSVAYGNMVGLLVEAIKEQQSEIDELKALVRQLLAK